MSLSTSNFNKMQSAEMNEAITLGEQAPTEQVSAEQVTSPTAVQAEDRRVFVK